MGGPGCIDNNRRSRVAKIVKQIQTINKTIYLSIFPLFYATRDFTIKIEQTVCLLKVVVAFLLLVTIGELQVPLPCVPTSCGIHYTLDVASGMLLCFIRFTMDKFASVCLPSLSYLFAYHHCHSRFSH